MAPREKIPIYADGLRDRMKGTESTVAVYKKEKIGKDEKLGEHDQKWGTATHSPSALGSPWEKGGAAERRPPFYKSRHPIKHMAEKIHQPTFVAHQGLIFK